MNKLYVFLNSLIGKSFVWGECDCMIILGDWVKVVHGYDPVEHLRYTYDSPASCHRQTGFYTDPVGAVAKFAEGICGFEKVSEPTKGDVGLLGVPHGGKVTYVGGIYTGSSWAVKAPEGVTTLQPYEVKAIWSVGYEE